MPYLLDTDSESLAFGGNERVRSRICQALGVHLSSIAAEERVRGALSLIHRSRDTPGLPAAQDFLTRLLYDISIIAFMFTTNKPFTFMRPSPPESSASALRTAASPPARLLLAGSSLRPIKKVFRVSPACSLKIGATDIAA